MKQALIAALLGAGLMAFSAPSMAHSPGYSQSHSPDDKPYKNHHDHYYSGYKAHLKHDRAVRKYKTERHKNFIKKQRLQHKKWHARHYHPAYGHRHLGYRNHYHIHHHRHGGRDNDYLEWLGIMLLLDEALEDDYR